MSERNGGRGPEARGSGSSLTDAVVAALANVSSSPPPGGSSGSDPDSKPPAAPAGNAQPDVKPSPTVVTGTPGPAPASPVAPTAADAAEPPSEPTLPTAATLAERADATEPNAAPPADATEPSAAPTAATQPGDTTPPSDTTQRGDTTQPSAAATAGRPVRDDAPTQKMPAIEPLEAETGADERMPSDPVVSTEEIPRSEPTLKVGGAPVEAVTSSAATSESAGARVEGIGVEYYGRTDVGLVREHNEDNFLVADLSAERRGNDGAILKTTLGSRGMVLAVCDGMGGAAAGEVASQMAVDTVYEILQAGGPAKDRDQFARRLVHAIEEAGARIFSAAKMDRTRRGMGTTATVAGLVDSTLFVGQVGDSRAYVLRGDQFALITKDQSLVNQLIEAGQLTEEEAEAFEHSNIILQALGTTEEVTVDLTFLELRRGDRLLLCSDGLSGLVHADMMREVLKSSRDLSEAAQQMIAMANSGGGHDNITVILAEFDGTALREASADARVAYQQYPLPPEDPSRSESTGKSATTIKSGGPKPGADVKAGEVRDGAPVAPGHGRLWVAAIVVLLLLMGIAALIVMMDDGEHEGAADDATTRVTIASEVSARTAPQPAAEGRVVVRTDAEGGVLYVNGQRSTQPLGADGTTLSLAPGAYRLEIRQGDVRIADTTVTVESGREEQVALTMPAGAVPEPGGDTPPPEGHTDVAIPQGGLAAPGPQQGQGTLSSPVAQQQVAQQQRGPASTTTTQAPPATPPATAQQAPATPGQVL